jgi:predicted RNA-binding Zn-ribbon protein involved in translation (DUF1610 family)
VSIICAIETCDRPVPDTSFVCPPCGARFRAQLERIPDELTLPGLVALPDGTTRRAIDGGRTVYGIASSLDQVIARQTHTRPDRADERGPLAISETPLPYNPAASEVRTVLVGTLTFWAAAISEQRGLAIDDWTPAGLATFLAGQVDWLRAQGAGADAFDELGSAIRHAERATDRPADRKYAGPCTQEIELDGVQSTCGTDLYARPDRDVITCPTCGTEVPVAKRRAWLLDLAQDRLLPVRELVRAIDGLGVPLSQKTIESWVQRKQLTAHGTVPLPDGRTAKTYRVGDVLDRVQESALRRRHPSANTA